MVEKITIKGCSEDSVFSEKHTALFKITEVLERLQEAFSDYRLGSLAYQKIQVSSDCQDWLTDGIDCEILEPGNSKGWQKGKMRLKVKVEAEFIPDEPEPKKTKPASPLDDLRKKIKEQK